jgi:hypothetical protein
MLRSMLRLVKSHSEREGIRRSFYTMALMSNGLEFEPSTFQEATDQRVWWGTMVEEYTSIMKNDVWNIVPRIERKSIMISRWLYNIKHTADVNIENFKVSFIMRGFF